MPDVEKKPRFKIGDKVKFKIGNTLIGTVSEVRYARHGSGLIRYRVRVPMEAEPLWFELFEDEVEAAQ